jgi:hypothetical protein
VKWKAVDAEEAGIPQLPATQTLQQPVVRQQVQAEPEGVDGDGQEGQQEKAIHGNPFARARIVERERDIERKRADKAEEQLTTLLEALNKSNLGQAQEEVEIEESLNPLEAISKKQDQVLLEVAEWKKQQTEKEQAQVEETEDSRANGLIQSFVAQAEQAAPGLYTAAVAHLSNVWVSEYLEDNPDADESDANEHVANRARELKLRAAANGLNPGQEFLRRSALVGFRPDLAKAAQKAPQAPKAPKPIPPPVQEIAQQQERRQALGSISSMQGSSTQDPMRGLASLPEKERVKALMSEMKNRGRMSRTIPLSETLAHKMVR